MQIDFLKIFFLLAIFFMLPNFASAANFPLEITNIKPAGTGSPAIPAANRIFRAYPDIEYNIRAAVIGGVYPYTFSLSNAPSGMDISENGTITWIPSSEIYNADPMTVESIILTVTDFVGEQIQTTWSIEVTKGGFHFIDASYVGLSIGDFEQPYKSASEMLQGLSDLSRNDIVYFRGGSYILSQYGPDAGYVFMGGVQAGYYRPSAWLGYPNENVSIDNNKLIIRTDTLWLDNINFSNMDYYGFWLYGSTGHYSAIRRSSFSGFTNSVAQNNNQGIIYASGGATSNRGYGLTVQDNEFSNYSDGQAIGSLYNGINTLIEDNYIHDGGTYSVLAFCSPIGIKARNSYYAIRHNRVIMPGSASNYDIYNELAQPDNAEFSYNYVLKSSGGNGKALVVFYPTNLYLYRNTIIGNVEFYPLLSAGPIAFNNNVLIGNLINGVNVTSLNNLIGSADIVDVNGLLINRSDVGIYGWETANGSGDVIAPSAPSGFLVM
ncbi:MAG: hypothetical protein HGA36_03790 [Candidatus Moranbacteria bacterium]|nr:hypothetical protein [Candidatus Moranbacteria bacterium]